MSFDVKQRKKPRPATSNGPKTPPRRPEGPREPKTAGSTRRFTWFPFVLPFSNFLFKFPDFGKIILRFWRWKSLKLFCTSLALCYLDDFREHHLDETLRKSSRMVSMMFQFMFKCIRLWRENCWYACPLATAKVLYYLGLPHPREAQASKGCMHRCLTSERKGLKRQQHV